VIGWGRRFVRPPVFRWINVPCAEREAGRATMRPKELA